MYTLQNQVPIVGSIRDDGPLPETITDAVASQREMKNIQQSNDGRNGCNSLTLYWKYDAHILHRSRWRLQEITTLCVDQTESWYPIKDRGTHQAFGVVTNAQDFMRLLN